MRVKSYKTDRRIVCQKLRYYRLDLLWRGDLQAAWGFILYYLHSVAAVRQLPHTIGIFRHHPRSPPSPTVSLSLSLSVSPFMFGGVV